jgi:lipopolysaccharide biosynthesis regulator YciM
MMMRAADADSLNANYQENVAAVMIQRHMDDDAAVYLERLVRLQPKRSEVQMQLVDYYRRSGETEKALQGLDAIEKREGRTLVTTNEKFELYME